MDPSKNVRIVGWLTREKGQSLLATALGKFRLEHVPPAGAPGGGRREPAPAAVIGELTGPSTIAVKDLRVATRPQRGRQPYFTRHPMTELAMGSRLRGTVHTWLRERSFLELTLPTVWGRSEEYGAEEFTVTHSASSAGHALKMLQSSEFPLYTALAEGVDRCFTFGRCYRLETDAEPDRSDDYLMEFEQLVIAASFTDLTEMVALAQQLIVVLAGEAGVELCDEDFCTVGPPGLAPADLVIDDLLFFTVPPHWPLRARQTLYRRLVDLGSRVHRLDADPARPLGDVGTALRWAIEPSGASPSRLRRVLEIADSFLAPGVGDVNQALVRQWNLTWNVYPPLQWRDDERRDSTLPVRSITSRRDRAANGVECIADAELYLAGREVVHVRAYADAGQFAENLSMAGISDAGTRYGYLVDALETAPPGMVGIFIGWERLLSALTGTGRAADALLFPRGGDGRLRRPCGPAW